MRRRAVPSCVLGLLLAACSTYDTAYRFDPKPTGAVVAGDAGPAGRVEATALGLRDAGSCATGSIDVRVRLERFGATPVRVDTESLRLRTRDRTTLALRDVRTRGAAVPAAGGAASLDAEFALPCREPGVLDLRGLELLATVRVGDRTQAVTLRLARDAGGYAWQNPWDWGRNDPAGRATGWCR